MLPPHTNLDSGFDEQFAETLRYCKTHIPFYRDRWRHINPVVQFEAIPTIRKSDLRSRGREFLNCDLATRHLLHTSGTTGDPLTIPRCSEEVAFVNDVFTALARERAVTRRSLGLSIRDNVHGLGPSYQSDILWIGDPSFTPPTLELAAQYLQRHFDLPGCDSKITSIFMSLLEVLHFTEFVRSRGLDVPRTSVKTVYSTGFPTCAAWNTLLENYWQCRHVSVFSLAEVFGQALSCSKCGDYHWDPFSVVEFLNPNNLSVVDEGIARLVLTTLYPYTQMMPLVRYDSGDLVEVHRGCPNGVGFRSLGRMHTACRMTDGVIIPMDADILNALSDCRWIRRTKPFVLQKLALSGTDGFGMPQVAMQMVGSDFVFTLPQSDNVSTPTEKEIQQTAIQLQEACRRALSRARQYVCAFNVRIVVAPIPSTLNPMFGCATAGLPYL